MIMHHTDEEPWGSGEGGGLLKIRRPPEAGALRRANAQAFSEVLMPQGVSADPRGRQLQWLREHHGLDPVDLATLACISLRQLYQLECGEDSLFYNTALRDQAGRRVAVLLGVQWDTLADMPPPPLVARPAANVTRLAPRSWPAPAAPQSASRQASDTTSHHTRPLNRPMGWASPQKALSSEPAEWPTAPAASSIAPAASSTAPAASSTAPVESSLQPTFSSWRGTKPSMTPPDHGLNTPTPDDPITSTGGAVFLGLARPSAGTMGAPPFEGPSIAGAHALPVPATEQAKPQPRGMGWGPQLLIWTLLLSAVAAWLAHTRTGLTWADLLSHLQLFLTALSWDELLKHLQLLVFARQ